MSENLTHDFLKKEAFLRKSYQKIEKRLNFYFAAVTVVIAFIGFSSDININNLKIDVPYAGFILLFLVFLLGLMTFNWVIQGHISITNYKRGINIIRRYFEKENKEAGIFVFQPIGDDTPLIGQMGLITSRKAPSIRHINLTTMTMLLNSLVASLFMVFSAQKLLELILWQAFLMGVSVFTLTLVLHERYANQKMINAEDSQEEHIKRLQDEIN